MKRKVEVSDLAISNIIEAYDWYESQRPGLGVELLKEWETATEYLSENAGNYQVKHHGFRHLMLKRFPYLIIYEIENEQLVVVFNIIHAQRNPIRRYKKKK